MALLQDGDGNTLVAAVEVAIGTKLGATIDSIAGVLLKHIPFFAKNDTSDEPLFFAAKERLAQRTAKSAAFPRGAVSMDDFNGDNAGLFGLTKFRKELLASFVDGGQSGFDIK